MTMNPEQIEQAAAELLARRANARLGPRLSPSCRPTDFEDAWQIQQAVSRGLGQPTGGWKTALPSPGKQVVAPIYAPTINHGAECALSAGATTPDGVRVEPELAFVLARNLAPRPEPYTQAEVDAAVGSVHAALEICASRYVDRDGLAFAELLADGLVNSGLWLGPALTAPEEPAFELTWQVEGEPLHTKPASHPDGDARAPLYWLVNFLRERGVELQAGQAIITGSHAGVLALPLEKKVRLGYGALASFEVAFTRQG